MRPAVAAALAALPLLPATARADVCVPAPRWDDRCEAWTAVWDGPNGGDLGSDEAVAAAVDGTTAFAAGDSYDGSQGTYDVVVLARHTGTGALLWQRTIGGRAADRAGGVAAFGGVVYVATSLDRTVSRDGAWSFESGVGAVTTFALDARTGRTIWAATLPEPGAPVAAAADATGVYVAVTGVDRGSLVAYDRRGRLRWARSPGDAGPERLRTDPGGVVWTARLFGRDAPTAFAQRVRADGRVAWTYTTTAALPAAVAPDGSGGAYVATQPWAAVVVGTPDVSRGYNAPAATLVALDGRGRTRWSAGRGHGVDDLLATRGSLWVTGAAGAMLDEVRTEDLDPRTGAARRTVAVADPRASFRSLRLVPAGRAVAVAGSATDRGTAYCLTYAAGPEGDEPLWVARWSQSPAQQDGCTVAGAGTDRAGRVVVTATYLYVPARWRAPFVANFRDVAMLAYDAA